ncbi:MAG: hypothetical protein LCH95_14610 [Proteobacteria bacterium]|nr:hypothetical protein [Pseudomonadota bacterium]
MRRIIGPTALGLLIIATGCVENTGYPTTYGYQPQPTYYSARPVYYQAPAYTAPVYYGAPAYRAPTVYVAQPAPPPHRHHRHPRRDWDD